ncbi:HIT family protein [Paenisporosarcina cavernae]|uniref:HIT family protein n=1 Tax=Paenisporosarcina cavernae TaxID=2320858 RepID=A0A385YVE2_9BACL|nr:HIT family protein [Paenisporosarcina cavernae]AYC30656.1 HIT family protein [Paenisporosarcina cavernae]
MKKMDCIYCHPEKDQEQQIVFENEYCLFLQHPKHQTILEGTGVIVPRAHKQTVFDLSPEEWNATYDLLQKVKNHLDEAHAHSGYTLGWNVGEVSNQTIPHAHLHVIPRFEDEPFANKGLRAWFKSEENRRPSR